MTQSEWDMAYFGYAYANGLLSKNLGEDDMPTEEEIEEMMRQFPDKPHTIQ